MKGVLSMQQTQTSPRRHWKRRALSLLMAAVMVLGLCPVFPGTQASAAHWADPYLSQLVEWGVISTAQAQNPDRALTRADFMGIVNRAYGYHEPGETPFEDVAVTDWYYDDVGIAYNAQYIKGTSPTTASPKDPLTRETATTILGRNMMLQDSAGEILDFTDARRISTWAQGTIKSSLEHYLVSGYDDGTFRPQRNVSWGEMASMVTRLIGTPLQEAGDYSLGGTFGNVTITSPGVTLRDTVVSGDLYITAGVGLGDVKLENVTVLGRIIASGTGSSEGGASILLRNVTADELLVDNLQGNEVSVRADGITEIGSTTVRTSAYIEDNTPEGLGLHMISLEGESYPEGEEPEDWEPIKLTLAGRIEEVVNRTPGSTVHAAKGTVAKLTVDETAVESNVIIDRNTVVKNLILDTAVEVTGEGDITRLEVNAPGCVVEMLPDEIVIRPGITAEINGEIMDSVAAEESSKEPMILAGYPEARDIIPNGLDAVFMTNKSGTIYWAVSAVTDGSVGEEDLIKPPSYGNIAVSTGSLKVAKGNEETTAKITGLTPGGSYYLSAVLVDARDKRSTTKVISFTTPDNTTPAFCAGYPHMSKVSRTDSVVVVMPNKDCKLYYALLPQGAAAPTETELKTNSVAGALGYGVRDVTKNVEDVFRVNDVILDEVTTYVLYLWLVDADGVNKSAIYPLTFTTDDETPPEFIVDPTVNKVQATSVGLTFRLNENGTVYWVAVPAGTLYPKPEPGTDYETAPLNSDFAKLQVSSGMNIGTDGKAGKVTAKENADGTITVSGLKPETTYDFYYVAKDNAGPDRNYSVSVKKITINTLDTSGPKFTQSFSKTSGTDKTIDPMSNTDIYLDVSENVRYTGQNGGKGFLELYQDVKVSTGDAKTRAINLLAANLFGSIKLHKVSLQDNSEETVLETHNTNIPFTEDMTIDYTQAVIEARSGGGIRITFPASGLHLENGGQYYFTIGELTDTSNNQNEITPDPVDFWSNAVSSEAGGHKVPPFVVEFAAVNLSSPGVGAGDGPIVRKEDGTMDSTTVDGETEYTRSRVDMSFRMTPTSTSSVSDTISYDILLWSDSIVTFNLYYRVLDEAGKPIHEKGENGTGSYGAITLSDSEAPLAPEDYLLPQQRGHKGYAQADENGWIFLGESGDVNPSQGSWSGKSVNKWFNNCGSTSFPQLNHLRDQLRYEFVITLQSYKGNKNFSTWNGEVKFHVNVAAGQSNNLDNLAGQLTLANWDRFKKLGMSGGARSIGRWNDPENQLVDTQELVRFFTDSSLPRFYNSAPRFENITSNSVDMYLALDNPGTVYYVIGKASTGPGGTPEITTTRYILDEDTADETAGNGKIDHVGGTTDQMYVTLTGPNAPTDSGNVSLQPMPNWMKGTSDVPPTDNSKDEPGKTNQLITPTNLNIFSPGSWSSGANAISGEVRSEAFRVEPKVVEDLEPNTDYFAYFVIKGESDDLSHVYVYHFKTNKSAKPKIGINPIADGSVDMWTDIPATMAYILFTVDDAEDKDKLSLLTQKFSGLIDTNGDYIDQGKTIPTKWQGLTVLEALCTTYSYTDIAADERDDPTIYVPKSADGSTAAYEGGYSVFDIYAGANIRREVDELIRNNLHNDGATRIDFGSNINSPGGGEKDGRFNQALKDVIEGNKYVILTVAQNPVRAEDQLNAADYELDSFKGYYNVEKSAGASPNLIEVLGGTPQKSTTADTYTGSLILHFDKNLYTGTPPKPLTDTNITALNNGFNKTNPSITVTASTTATDKQPSPDFTLAIGQMKPGDVISLPPSPPVLANASGATPDENLTVTLESYTEVEEATGDTVTYLRFTVNWGKSDPYQWAGPGLEIKRVPAPTPPNTGGNTGGGTTTDLTPVKPTGLTVRSTSGAKLETSVSTISNYTLKLDSSNMQSNVSAVVTPAEATDRVYWTSSNPSVASVAGSNRTAVITGKTAGTATISVTVGTLTKKILVTVAPGINITSFTANSDKSSITANSDGTYTWTRKDGLSYASKLKFSSSLNLTNGQVTVTSSDPQAVSVGTVSTSGKNGEVQLTFGSLSSSQVVITIKAGGVERKITIKLVGNDAGGANLFKTK